MFNSSRFPLNLAIQQIQRQSVAIRCLLLSIYLF